MKLLKNFKGILYFRNLNLFFFIILFILSCNNKNNLIELSREKVEIIKSKDLKAIKKQFDDIYISDTSQILKLAEILKKDTLPLTFHIDTTLYFFEVSVTGDSNSYTQLSRNNFIRFYFPNQNGLPNEHFCILGFSIPILKSDSINNPSELEKILREQKNIK